MIGCCRCGWCSRRQTDIVANNDVEIGARVEKETSTVTQRDVFAASGIVRKSAFTNDRVETAGGVVRKREVTDSRVFPALGVGIERIETDGRVAWGVII